jgi:hypothetical protein
MCCNGRAHTGLPLGCADLQRGSSRRPSARAAVGPRAGWPLVCGDVQWRRPAMATLKCCSGHDSRAAIGTKERVTPQQLVAFWKCCSGRAARAALGTQAPASRRRAAATWRCCSGHGSRAAPGMSTPAARQPAAATCMCCSGHSRRAAPGMRTPAARQPAAATCMCCSGRLPLAEGGPPHPLARRRAYVASGASRVALKQDLQCCHVMVSCPRSGSLPRLDTAAHTSATEARVAGCQPQRGGLGLKGSGPAVGSRSAGSFGPS